MSYHRRDVAKATPALLCLSCPTLEGHANTHEPTTSKPGARMMNGKVSPMDYDDGVSAESGSGVRKFLMFVYMLAAWGVAAALIVAVFQA